MVSDYFFILQLFVLVQRHSQLCISACLTGSFNKAMMLHYYKSTNYNWMGASTIMPISEGIVAHYIWTASSEFSTYRLCEQRRFRRACASAQSRQNLRCSLIQAVNQEEPSDRKPDPWPSEWLGMRSWNLSWRNARRHKFAWRGPYNILLSSDVYKPVL